MDASELREQQLAYLRGATEVRFGFGTVTARPLGAAIEVSCARHRTGEHRIYVMRRDPPKLLLRLVWGAGRQLTRTHFELGDWLDNLPAATARRKSEPPPKFNSDPEFNNETRRRKPWSAR